MAVSFKEKDDDYNVIVHGITKHFTVQIANLLVLGFFIL